MIITRSTLLLLIVFLVFTACKKNEVAPKVVNGKIELSQYDFNIQEPIKLDGEWDFYWKQTPLDDLGFFDINYLKEKEKINIPSTWNSLGKNEKGYGTFRIRIKLNESNPNLTLRIPQINFAAEVWVNGEKIHSMGQFSKSEKENIVKAYPAYVNLPKKDDLDIMILVSNYKHRNAGGFNKGMFIGNRQKIEQLKNITTIIQASTSFFIMVICIYQIFIYFNDRKRKLFLLFGLFCFIGSIRQLFVGEVLIYNFFQNISFNQVIMFRYFPLYTAPLILLFYYKELFPKDSLKWFITYVIVLSSLLFLYVIFADSVYWKTQSRYLNRVLAWTVLMYMLWISIVAAIRKRKLSKIILFNSLLAIVFLANDLLHMDNIIRSSYLTNFGLLSFLLLQTVINHKVYLETEVKVEKLSERLDTMREEITKLLSESIQQLQKKKEITNKLNSVYETTRNKELIELVAELRSEKLENERKLILKENMEQLNADFISRLLKEYPNITRTDIEICSFIRLGFSSSEIAKLRGTAMFSVKSSRYRLRKKLQLEKEIRLTSFLKEY